MIKSSNFGSRTFIINDIVIANVLDKNSKKTNSLAPCVSHMSSLELLILKMTFSIFLSNSSDGIHANQVSGAMDLSLFS